MSEIPVTLNNHQVGSIEFQHTDEIAKLLASGQYAFTATIVSGEGKHHLVELSLVSINPAQERIVPLRYCDECGSQMTPVANMTGYSLKTGKPLYALWLKCYYPKCTRYRAGVPTSYLHKSKASEQESLLWTS